MKITITDFTEVKKKIPNVQEKFIYIYTHTDTYNHNKTHIPEMTLGFLAIYAFHFLVLSWAGDGITTLLTLHGNVNKAPT